MALDQKTDGVWKSGKGKGRKTAKGRQVNEDAISDVKLLLGNRERRAVNVLDLVDRMIVVNEEKCTHCELCIPSCPVFALDIVEN